MYTCIFLSVPSINKVFIIIIMAFLPSGIFTNGIFTIIWHIYQWHFYHLTFLPMSFLQSDSLCVLLLPMYVSPPSQELGDGMLLLNWRDRLSLQTEVSRCHLTNYPDAAAISRTTYLQLQYQLFYCSISITKM